MAGLFRRKLIALGYHSPDTFNVKDVAQFRYMIVWLEDQKIRHYKIEDRGELRNTDSNEWNKAYQKYLEDIECPHSSIDWAAVMDWILGFAVRLEYGDNLEKYKSVTAEHIEMKRQSGKGMSSNPLDNLDFDDPHFKAGIASLAMLLQVPPHPSHTEQLKAICLLIKEKLSEEAVKNSNLTGNPKEFTPLDKTELGFDAGDYVMNDAAKVLRLLHIKELRDLQTQINRAIVKVQALTADPKTDSRLGKVGR